MKTLLLMRHAEAAGAAEDFDRTLTPGGREAAARLAGEMRRRSLAPALILCSAARRAAETCALVVEGLDGETPATADRALYLAPAEALLTAIHAAPEPATPLMVIGHNPGLQHLADLLIGGGAPQALSAMEEGFAAGAVAALDFDVESWASVAEGTGVLTAFLNPTNPG